MKKIALSIIMSCFFAQIFAQGTLNYSVSGLQSGDHSVVSFGSGSYLNTQTISVNGSYTFDGIPAGEYFIKIEATGYHLPNAQTIIVHPNGNIDPATGIKLAITKMEADSTVWTHSWSEDVSNSGYTTTAYVNNPPTIEFLGVHIVPSDVPFTGVLQNNYNIILSDEEEAWTQEYAYRLVETLKTLPCFSAYNMATGQISPAKFVLTEDHLFEDIAITNEEGGQIVRISKDCFYYANPFLVNLDGVRGRFFSKRLHHALVNFATNFGNDLGRVNSILSERFGCTTDVPDYSALTADITNEDAGRFQPFNPDELVSIINMFEELPEGFHKTPHLNYLIRRLNGTKHPIYTEAAAVAWAVDNGYIEFMETAFGGDANGFETLRLILHEKTHFLWAYTFSEEIKNEWITLGGWYPDPNSGSGWSTTKDTEFVSAYAHAHNPNEDMAESVAHYLKNPELLQSRSLPKYEFIRDRIMHGTRYISKIPDHLTFEVLNLYPDYDYPGKIKRLDVKVEGAPNEDKIVTVEIELNHMEGFEDGAIGGGTRITSPLFVGTDNLPHSQYVDIGFGQVDENPYILRGTALISKYSKTGYWTASDIIVTDIHGNQRFEGRNDCVWNMYVNNPLEDLEAPKYVENSLNYQVTDTIVDGRNAQNLRITYGVTDNVDIQTTVVRVVRAGGTHSYDDIYGTYDAVTHTATIEFLITEYMPSDYYWVTSLSAIDFARNWKVVNFSDSPLDEPIKKIWIETTNPDTEAPQVDLNRITVYAEPTHPEAPDGETLVTINYYAKDDKSGLGWGVRYSLRDPQGIEHGEWHYHQHFYDGTYFNGDPTVWEKYTITCVLPQGSAPGIWGLSELSVTDKAWNNRIYNFVETLIFEPDNSTTDYVLFSELENNIISLEIASETDNYFGFSYRIINEDTGEELTGNVNTGNSLRSSSPTQHVNVDVSGMSTGSLIVIVQIKDESDEIVAVRSTRVTKKATQTILFAAFATATFGDEPIVLNQYSDAGLEITYTGDNEDVATVSGNTVVLHNAGTAQITATQAGNSDYNAASTITRTLIVNKANQTIVWDNIPPKTYGDADFYLPQTTDKGLTIVYSSEKSTVAQVVGNKVEIKGAGNTTITATQAGNINYSTVSESQTLTVKQANLTIAAENKTRKEGEANPEFTLSYNGFKNDETESVLEQLPVITCSANSDSPVGIYDIVLSGGSDNNYAYNLVNGKLEITQSTGIAEMQNNASLRVYPNPAKNDLYLQSSQAIEKIELFNQTGICVIVKDNPGEKLDVSALPVGFYLARIYIEGIPVTTKILIKR